MTRIIFLRSKLSIGILIVIVVVALYAIHVYIKRGFGSGLKSVPDVIGEQYTFVNKVGDSH